MSTVELTLAVGDDADRRTRRTYVVFLYLVERAAPPGSGSRDEALGPATTLYERVKGRSAAPS